LYSGLGALKAYNFLALLVLVLAAFLRFFALDRVILNGDQADVLGIAHVAVEQGTLPAHSKQSSVGLAVQPLGVWLAMPVVMLAPDPGVAPAVAALVGASLDLLAVAFLYRLGRQAAGPVAGLVASAGYGSHLWTILFARRLLASNLMPFFALASLTAWWSFVRGSPWAFVWAALSTALLAQTHPAAAFTLPMALLALLLGWRNLRIAPVAIGLVLSALVWLPYLSWQFTEGFQDVRQALSVANAPSRFDATSLLFWDLLTSVSGGISFLGAPAGSLLIEPDWARLLQRMWQGWLVASLAILAVLPARNLHRRFFRPSPELQLWLLAAVAALGPPLLLIRHSFTIYTWYLLGSLPAAFLLVGLACNFAIRALNAFALESRLRYALTLFIGLSVVVPVFYEGALVLRFYRWQDEAVVAFFGLPLRWWRDFSTEVQSAREKVDAPVYAFPGDWQRAPLSYSALGRFHFRPFDANALVIPGRALVAAGTEQR
jgi:hypothetical protein